MHRPIEALAEELLQLPTEQRSKLLDRVVASLDADHKRAGAWDALAARRDAEIESGQRSTAVPATRNKGSPISRPLTSSNKFP